MFFKNVLGKAQKKPVLSLVVIEIVLLLAVFFVPRIEKRTEYHFDSDEIVSLSTPEMHVAKGSYFVEVNYIPAESNGYYHFNNSDMQKNEYDDGIRYDRDKVFNLFDNKLSTEIWLVRDLDKFSFSVDDTFDGTITDFSITRNFGDVNKNVVILTIFFSLADCLIYMFLQAQKNGGEYLYRFKGFAFILGTTALLTLPLFVDFMISAHDLHFHLIRIEGLKVALSEGQFPVRINNYALTGQGYADPIFYPYLFLYFPAVLRMLGLSIIDSYKIFEFVVIFAGVLISHYSFNAIIKDKRAALIGMFLYNVTPYHYACLYTRGAVGEYLAYAFIPLVVWGCALLLAEETDKESLKKGSLLLILGFSAIIQSHILSCEMTGIFLIVALIVFVKRFVRLKTFLAFVFSGLITLGLNMWFIVPFVSSLGMDYVVFNGEPSTIPHENALMLYQIFGARSNIFGYSHSRVGGISGEMGISIGLASCLCIIFVIIEAVNLYNKRADDSKNTRILRVSAFLAAMALWLTSDLFPWKKIEGLPVFGSIFGMVQFPWRYLGIGGLCLSLMAAAFFATKNSWEKYRKYAVIVLIAAVFLSISNMDSVITNSAVMECYDKTPTSTLGNEEYFLGETRPHTLYDGYQMANPDYRKDGDKYYYSVENSGEVPIEINTHMTYYPYYIVKDAATGEKFEPYSNEKGCLAFLVPEMYEGDFCVSVPESKKWLLGDFISLITAAVLIFAVINEFRRKKIERSN